MSEKILIVDDDIDSLKLIGLMLQRHGYEVIAANAGNQAISKASSELPDLIILDVMMPDMNGYDVCRRLRGNPDTKSIPIIMFTAKTLIDDKVAGFEAGADDYLTKPTHPAELASRVKAILQRSSTPTRPGTDERSSASVIGVIGSKGGIGTTTIALNVAAAFQNLGQEPIVADFRLGSGSLGLLLGVNKATGMGAVLQVPIDAIPQAVSQQLITHASGLKALLSSTNPHEGLVEYSGDQAVAVIESLRTVGNPVVIDLGSGYSPLINVVHTKMDGLLVLVEPTSVNLTMTRTLVQELARQAKDRIHIVVVNRNKISLQPQWHEIEEALGHEIRASITAAPELTIQAMDAGTPVVLYQPNAIMSSQINKLAENLQTAL
jgi:CheY-like chemotaxis protein/MinD-like ATPase involved in chromosome partitioning or flagellar assembly